MGTSHREYNFLMALFTRSQHNPIVAPTHRWWESRSTLNPGVALYQGRVAIVYRAVGGDGLSRLGLAWSRDGETIDDRLDLPLYEGALDDPYARLGVEDPRITPLDGSFYITYCKASVASADTPPLHWEFSPFRVRSGIGVTQDFRVIEEKGILLPDADTKDAVLFPERIGGRYAALVREYPSIQYVTSSDLIHWSDPITVLDPVPHSWEQERIGAGPPPVRTPWGWLLIYHGNEYLKLPENERMYRAGIALLDAREPWKLLYRHPDPIFSPEAPYEVEGPVGNVVFATGLLEREGRYYLYYGAGDGVIGVATADVDAVHDLIRPHAS
ncbi:MAG TPA: hypothetical protein VF898_13015 [Chloroflexota bacterium]